MTAVVAVVRITKAIQNNSDLGNKFKNPLEFFKAASKQNKTLYKQLLHERCPVDRIQCCFQKILKAFPRKTFFKKGLIAIGLRQSRWDCKCSRASECNAKWNRKQKTYVHNEAISIRRNGNGRNLVKLLTSLSLQL